MMIIIIIRFYHYYQILLHFICRHARLKNDNAWANNLDSSPPDLSPWIQIDLRKDIIVTGIIAQGFIGSSGNHRWIRNFKFQFGSSPGSLDYIKDSNGQAMVGIMILVYWF